MHQFLTGAKRHRRALANPVIALWLQAWSIMDRPALNVYPRFMSGAIIALLVVLFAGARALAATPVVDDALLVVARKSLPKEISTNEIAKALQAGLWNSNRTAVAVSFPRAKASVVFVFLRQTNGAYLAVDASGVEVGNFGKLGRRRSEYDRFETTPVEWLSREDGLFQIVMRTRAWKAGQRYTVSEPLIIQPDGIALWR
jgi:hypothetical protein